MVGLIVIAPSTALVAMSRSNVNWTVVSTGTSLPVGVIAVTRGGPVVAKTQGSMAAVAALPARSSKPASIVTWNVVADGRRGDGLAPMGVPGRSAQGHPRHGRRPPVDERRVVEEDPKDQERNERQADPE